MDQKECPYRQEDIAKLTREREERRLKEEQVKREAERRRLEEAKRAHAEKTAQSANKYPEAIVGEKVQHKPLGIGTIKNIRGTVIDVEFNGEEKHFSYPTAFEQKFLTQVIGNADEPTRHGGFQDAIKQELEGYGIEYTYNSDS